MDDGRVSGDGPAPLRALLAKALKIQREAAAPEDHDAAWLVLHEARPFGRLAFDAAVALLGSDDAAERTVGCDLLASLCDPDEEDWGPGVASAVSRMAEGEGDADVLWSVAQALRFAEDHRGLATLFILAGHPDRDVRSSVATAPPSCEGGRSGGSCSGVERSDG